MNCQKDKIVMLRYISRCFSRYMQRPLSISNSYIYISIVVALDEPNIPDVCIEQSRDLARAYRQTNVNFRNQPMVVSLWGFV